jgi:hypothetical protein
MARRGKRGQGRRQKVKGKGQKVGGARWVCFSTTGGVAAWHSGLASLGNLTQLRQGEVGTLRSVAKRPEEGWRGGFVLRILVCVAWLGALWQGLARGAEHAVGLFCAIAL